MSSESRATQKPNLYKGRLPCWLLTFALAYALLHVLPPYMQWEIRNKLWVGDIFDLLTPFAMILVIYRIVHILARVENDPSRMIRPSVVIILLLGSIAFVEGHGMHLSANAITRHLQDERSSSYALAYLFDEVLGHIFWHSGIVLLSLGLIQMGFDSCQEADSRTKPVLISIAAAFYGFTYFADAVEGQTVIFAFPLAVLIPILTWGRARRVGLQFGRSPVLSFFLLGYAFATGLFLFWGIWRGGFPQFSELNWL